MRSMRILGHVLASAALAVGLCGSAVAADNYYFRLRPSIQIFNQESFSVRIDGDRAGIVGSRFSAKAEASSPRETLRFSVTAGAFPPGISIDANSGTISGYPTAKGTFNATVMAQDAFSTASAEFSVIVYDALEIESTVSRYATVGQPYSASFKGLGGTGSFAWTLIGDAPGGLTFGNVASPTAILSGVPTVAGTWDNLRVNLEDGSNHSATSSPFSIIVADPLTLSGTPSPVATIGEAYSAVFASTGGHPEIQWSMSGTLPKGIGFNNGVISGTPTDAETASGLVVKVTDDAGNTMSSDPFSIAVSQPLSIFGTPPSFATIGVSYSTTFTASGGDGHYTWSLARGTLPTNLQPLNGTISGMPTEAGNWSDIVLRVSDGIGRTAESLPFSIAISNPLEMTGTPSGIATVGAAYSAMFTAAGGTGNYTWDVAAGSLPKGLMLSGGVISGQPTEAGASKNIVVRVSDENGRTKQSEPFSITVSNVLAVSGSPIAIATVGEWYRTSFTVSGGDGNYQWSYVGSAPPPGLYVNNTPFDNFFEGVPTSAGTFNNIILRLTDGGGRTVDTNPFSVTVSNPVSISGSLASSAKEGVSYSSTVSASGGTGSYTWSIFSGALPPGLSISGATVSGMPTTAGTYSVALQAKDSQGRTAQTGVMIITVAPGILREPASGEFYTHPESNTGFVMVADFAWSSTPFVVVNWNGVTVSPGPPYLLMETTQFSYGGATYYRGTLREPMTQFSLPVYGVYRTVP